MFLAQTSPLSTRLIYIHFSVFTWLAYRLLKINVTQTIYHKSVPLQCFHLSKWQCQSFQMCQLSISFALFTPMATCTLIQFITKDCFQQGFLDCESVSVSPSETISLQTKVPTISSLVHCKQHLCALMVFFPFEVRDSLLTHQWLSSASRINSVSCDDSQRPDDLALPLLQPQLILGSLLLTVPWSL